jgi:CheY-like chemotaxis protein
LRVKPDRLLERVIGQAAATLDAAQTGRGLAPLDEEATELLLENTRALVDLPDQQRVLWVDDRPEGNGLEAAALAHLQIEVVTALDTDAALRMLRDDAEGFDLVISDWTRPHEAEPVRAGLTLLEQLRREGRRVPLVFYHGARGDERVRLAAQARAAGAFGEATGPAELLTLVARALALPRPGA